MKHLIRHHHQTASLRQHQAPGASRQATPFSSAPQVHLLLDVLHRQPQQQPVHQLVHVCGQQVQRRGQQQRQEAQHMRESRARLPRAPPASVV